MTRVRAPASYRKERTMENKGSKLYQEIMKQKREKTDRQNQECLLHSLLFLLSILIIFFIFFLLLYPTKILEVINWLLDIVNQ